MKSPAVRILYAEDDADTRELITVVLGKENCQVIATGNHDEALRLARAEQFDLYLLDNWMPGISGIQLCQLLREVDPDTPVLFYSGAAYQADKEQALLSGAQGYLVKPVDGDELVSEVMRLIYYSRHSGSHIGT